MLPQLLKGMLLGIGAAAPIGPVNVEIARRTLTRGFRAGFALGLGAVTVDVTYALLSSLGMAQLAPYPKYYRPLQVAGAILLTYLGVMSLIAATRAVNKPDVDVEHSPKGSLYGGYVTGLLMTFFNPMTLLFWFTAVPSAAGSAQERGDLPIIAIGVFVATLGWVVFFASTLKA